MGKQPGGIGPLTPGDLNQYRVTMPKLPPPPPVCAHHKSRLGSDGSRGRYHAPGRPGLIHHDHLDAIEVVGGQPVLPTQVAESAAEHVPTDSDIGADTSWEGDSPAQEQLPVHLAEGGARLDGESAHVRVVVDARHQRGIDDDSHRRVRHKALQAVPSAAYRHPQLVAHRVLHGVHDLLSRVDEAHVVGLARKSFVDAPVDKVGIPQVIRSNLVRSNPWILVCL